MYLYLYTHVRLCLYACVHIKCEHTQDESECVNRSMDRKENIYFQIR